MNTVKIYLTDDTGRHFWETHCGEGYSSGEEHNLRQHLARIKAGHKAYAKVTIDRDSARFVFEGGAVDLSPEALLAWVKAGAL